VTSLKFCQDVWGKYYNIPGILGTFDLNSTLLHVEVLGHTPTPFMSVEGRCICLLPSESQSLDQKEEKEDFRIDSKVRCVGAYPFSGALSRRGFHPIKLASHVSQMSGSVNSQRL